jgi:hypothetical protein
MYYFTILGGLSQRSLIQYFQPTHAAQMRHDPGIWTWWPSSNESALRRSPRSFSRRLKHGYAGGGLVCLGWEDMRAYVAARSGNAAGDPAGGPVLPGAHAAAGAGQRCSGIWPKTRPFPVVAHLDHGYTVDECRKRSTAASPR